MTVIDDETKDDLDWEEWDPKRISFINHMIAGSIAGLVEHISIFPIDTIKTYSQYERNSSLSIWKNTNQIIHNEGFLRLWRGVSAMFAGCVPGKSFLFKLHSIKNIERNITVLL